MDKDKEEVTTEEKPQKHAVWHKTQCPECKGAGSRQADANNVAVEQLPINPVHPNRACPNCHATGEVTFYALCGQC